MPAPETSMGGGREAFPETAGFTRFAEAAPESPERQRHLSRLFTSYWRPIYKFIRASRRKSIEDAKDLTQEFFIHLLESDAIAGYRRDRGRFRHWLKGTLRNFLLETERDGRRLKRGGGKPVLSLDTTRVETERFQADLQRSDPEALFDQQWRREVVAETLRLLKESMEKDGRADAYDLFERYDIRPEGATYESLARGRGIGPVDVKVRLKEARERFREILLSVVGGYADSPAELEDELKDMLQP